MLGMLKRATFTARHRAAAAIFPMAKTIGPHCRASYSWCGEDLVALSWLAKAGIEPCAIRYLDIGAADPIEASNTCLLSKLGARGVLIEPDPDQAAKLRAARPRDVILNVGVAFDDRNSARLTRFEPRMLNTFSQERAAHIVDVAAALLIDETQVNLVSINRIIEEHLGAKAPDFLSTDTEGFDLAILSRLDMDRFKPTVICAEHSSSRAEFETLLGPHGYELICKTPDNFLFYREPVVR